MRVCELCWSRLTADRLQTTHGVQSLLLSIPRLFGFCDGQKCNIIAVKLDSIRTLERASLNMQNDVGKFALMVPIGGPCQKYRQLCTNYCLNYRPRCLRVWCSPNTKYHADFHKCLRKKITSRYLYVVDLCFILVTHNEPATRPTAKKLKQCQTI